MLQKELRVTVMPAYGRDYRSAKEAQQDWLAGKDFRCVVASEIITVNGRTSLMTRPCDAYCSIRDFPTANAEIRYQRGTRLTTVLATMKDIRLDDLEYGPDQVDCDERFNI